MARKFSGGLFREKKSQGKAEPRNGTHPTGADVVRATTAAPHAKAAARRVRADDPWATTFRITRGLGAALGEAARALQEENGLTRADMSLVLRQVLKEWDRTGRKVPWP